VRVEVGRVGKPHGLGGAFVVEQASEDPDRFAEGVTLLVGGEPARIVESKRAGGRPVIRLDREAARGDAIELDRSALPEPGEGEYYAFQLVGLEVEEAGGAKLGRVTAVSSGPANDVLELDTGALLPLVEDCIREVDLPGRRILLNPGFIG
jgi:16S rRNA processing protein RimM